MNAASARPGLLVAAADHLTFPRHWLALLFAALVSLSSQSANALVAIGDVVQVDGGQGHTCALTTAGGVKCWGDNQSGQLGAGQLIGTQKSVPVDVVGLESGVTKIAVGSSHACALTAGGAVKCWGSGGSGRLGNSSTAAVLTPVDVVGLSAGASDIASGGTHSCAVVSGGVKCWGSNTSGQLGDNSTTQRLAPVDVQGLSGSVVSITAGNSHTCARTSGGGAQCWGSNSFGALGNNSTTQSLVPVDVSGLTSGVQALASGISRTCAIVAGGVKCWGFAYGLVPADVAGLTGVSAIAAKNANFCALGTGGVKCWGSNAFGQVGDGTTTDRGAPVDVVGLSAGASDVASGGTHSCAVVSGGVKCWGSNVTGQLGDGTSTLRLVPVAVSGASGMTAISAGTFHTCEVTGTGGAKCWGQNEFGQVGDGTLVNRLTPVDVSGLTSGVAAISARGQRTCALTTTGGLKCWGLGALGNNSSAGSQVPVDVTGLTSGVDSVATGGGHICAVVSGGAKCWGTNSSGRLGDGSTTDRLVPVDVTGLTTGVTAVALGVSHSCALVSGGVKCWGANSLGQLGDNSSPGRITPGDVPGLTSGVSAISAGDFHACALTTTGGVKCWGGAGFNLFTPAAQGPIADIPGLASGVTAISANGFHTCALTNAGAVKCWGSNIFGQLGEHASGQLRPDPVAVPDHTSGVTAIAAGLQHTCALVSGGAVSCWGNNLYGQVGDGTGGFRAVPAPVLTWNTPIVPAVSMSRSHALALDATGKVHAWGSDSHGQLGQGRAINRSTPAAVTGIPTAVTQVSLSQHVLAIDSFRQVWSWGENACGQLGPREATLTSKPSRVLGVSNMKKVAAGGCFSLAIAGDDTVWGWGLVPGYGTETAPRQLSGLTSIVDIVAGSTHALARRADGTVFAFGDNAQGQLGQGSTGAAQAAVLVSGAAGAMAIVAGRDASAALVGGQVRLWGKRADGVIVTAPAALPALAGGATSISLSGAEVVAALADGTVSSFATPAGGWQPVAGYAGITKVQGGLAFSVGIGPSGQVFARGTNYAGQLGNGNTSPTTAVVTIAGMTNVATVVAGAVNPSVLALKSDGSLWFWGADTLGESGDGSAVGSSVPLLVNIPTPIRAIAAGDRFSLALDVNGDVWGWGDNGGAAIMFDFVNRSTPARFTVSPISSVQSIAAGGSGLAVFLMVEGTVAVGGTLVPGVVYDYPIGIPDLNAVTAIAAGTSGYALASNNTLYAFGANASGELGNGTTTASTTPVAVQGISGTIASIAAGSSRAGAVTSDGKVWSWGGAPLGNGAAGGSLTAVQVSGITDAAELSVGSTGSMVRRTSGNLSAWGNLDLDDAASQNLLLPYAVAFHEPVRSAQLGRGNTLGHLIGNTGLMWGFGAYGAISTSSASIGDGTYVRRTRPVVLLAASGAGNIDTNNWYLDLIPASGETVPAASTPKMLGVSQLFGSDGGLAFDATIKYRSSDFGKSVSNYVFGLVPAEFFNQVKSTLAPASMAKIAKAAKDGAFVLAQLTPAGWTDVSGQLIAYSSGTANAGGGATNILNGVPASKIPGARFCIGYGESSGSMLTFQALREVLLMPGASANTSGVPCVLSGVYVDGPPGSKLGTAVTFTASVVGLSPGGTVTFHDAGTPLSSQPISTSNDAVAGASISTSSLALGNHSIGAAYSGDSQNAAVNTEVPLRHAVLDDAAVTLTGPANSNQSSPVAFTATVIGTSSGGASPTGTVQFKDGGLDLGAPVTLAGGRATLRTSALAAGNHALTAAYSGDGANGAATSATLPHAVHSGYVTTLTLVSSAPTAVAGNNVTITATLASGGGVALGGTVTFRNGNTVLGSAPAAGGSAAVIGTFTPGLHNITADYSGDGTNAPASASLFQEVKEPPRSALTVTKAGSGSGTVTSSSPAGAVDCGSTCTGYIITGTTATLTASPAQGSVFSGWSGGCSGTGNCVVTMDSAKGVTATFTATHVLQVAKAGTGTGTITSSAPTGIINCGSACSSSFDSGTVVTLAASASTGSTFTGWSGACSGTGGCTVTMDAAKNVSATFMTSAALGLNPTSIDFGGQSMATTSGSRPVTVSNTGSLPLTVTGVELSSSQFGQTNNCAAVAAGASCTVNVTFTPAVASAASVPVGASLTVRTQQSGEGTVSLFGSGERSLVTHYYSSILRRAPDAGGKAFWENQAARVAALGASVNETWFAMAQQFYFSGEYAAFNSNNTSYATDLYNTFYNRAPDSGGLNHWVGQLDQGLPREVLLASFMFSAEFANFTNAIFGIPTARAEVNTVVDFYRGLLARTPDDGGFNFWVGRFRTAQCQGPGAVTNEVEAISSAFAVSGEYAARGRTNAQYVGDLYNAFLRRGGDLGGVQYWINQIAGGFRTREQVRIEFKNSPEFQGRVNAIIQQGCL